MKVFAPINSPGSDATDASSTSSPINKDCERGAGLEDEKDIESMPSVKSKQQDDKAIKNETADDNNGQFPAAVPALDVSNLVSPMKTSKSIGSLVELVDPKELQDEGDDGNITPLDALQNRPPVHRLVNGKHRHNRHHYHHYYSASGIKRQKNVFRPKLWNGMEIKDEEESTVEVLIGMAGMNKEKYTSNITGYNGHGASRNSTMHSSLLEDINVDMPGLKPASMMSKGDNKTTNSLTSMATAAAASSGADNLWKSASVGFAGSKQYSLRKKSDSKKRRVPALKFVAVRS